MHATLNHTDEGWEILVLSRNGVFMKGKRIEQQLLQDGHVFRLSDRGPWIRYRTETPAEDPGGGATISFDSSKTPIFALDLQQLDREVKQIADGQYFQELQKRMTQLRSRPASGS